MAKASWKVEAARLTGEEKGRFLLLMDELMYSPDNFPGTPAWSKHQEVREALRAWMGENPEIVAKWETTAAEKRAARLREIGKREDGGWI